MKYMLMIHHNGEIWTALPEEEQQAIMAEGGRLWQGLVKSGEGIMGEPLGAPADARIVRVRNGVAEVTDGPYAESREQFVGFMMVDVANEARAVEIASSWPDARYMTLEVRFVRDDNARETAEAALRIQE